MGSRSSTKSNDPSAISDSRAYQRIPIETAAKIARIKDGARLRGELNGQGLPVGSLVRLLTQQLGRTVLDKTGLTGKYDFTLQWTPDESQAPMFKGTAGSQPGTSSTTPPESSGPSIFTAIQEQLGLKLESQKGPVEILVIDHVEKPSEN